MGSNMQNLLLTLLIVGGSITAFVLFVIFIAVPLFKGIGMVISALFRAVAWFFTHIFEFIIGVLSDVIRFIGALLAMVVLIPLVPLNIVIGRWSAAGHFAEGVKRECQVGAACVYRALLRRPLKLLLLHGLLEGLEQRVPEAMQGAPGSDKPSHRAGQFDGYTILGSLRSGGSGAKLYVAEPSPEKIARVHNMPKRVVIKSFAITEGSSLPQIVRESRALECAKQLGHVLDHGMDNHRFYYVMPYHPGDHLGILTRQMHGECGSGGLDQKRLGLVMSYMRDLLVTLSAYHKGGLWHKDVKPENVIVHDGRAHLVDLGLVTPLRSAMTLTTHGTEYFRDPEMVRQALRGVKVHQVDGAKFDIYAAGAVLYFMIENTFPAHGGLSRFVTNSPEALRWIIRRAMTDYNQRYETADEMLADLDYVMSAPGAFAVKPAQLPSMRGEPDSAPRQAEAEVVAVAGSAAPRKPAFQGFGISAGIGPQGAFAQVGTLNLDENGQPLKSNPSTTSRPRLAITNWWTGEYRVVDGESDNAGEKQSAQTFREQAFAFRQQAGEIGRQARAGVISARKAAREQLKAARQRARDIRTRAAAHRHRAVPRSSTPTSAIVIGTLSVLILGGILTLAFISLGHGPSPATRFAIANAVPGRQPLLLVVDASNPADARLQAMLKNAISKQQRAGYDVIVAADSEQATLQQLVKQWMSDRSGPVDETLEALLAMRNAYGVLYVKAVEDKRKRVQRITDTLIRSSRPGAASRRQSAAAPIASAPSLPYLLINDHPFKAEPKVEAAIESTLKKYREQGWMILTNDEVEVNVRKSLPTGPIDQTTPMPPTLYATLSDVGFGGIVRIVATRGDAPPHERVGVTVIQLESLPVPGAPERAGDAADAAAVVRN
jgi:serine/threonine protein kinase